MEERHMFRGLDVEHGRWHYGSYTVNDNGDHMIITSSRMWRQEWITVIPETVGQSTGETDKNEKMTYEGDILTCQTRYGIDRGVVVWKDGGLKVFWDSRFSFPEKYHIKAYYGFTSYNAVIGNIHDNPELLEVSE